MKKIISIVSLLSVMMTGCLKDKPLNDFSTITPIVELPYHGLEGLSGDAILTAGATDPIVVPLVINIASVNPLSKDVTVTLAVDDGLRTSFNAAHPPPGVQYEQLPDSTYSFPVTTGTIKAGSRLDTLYVTFYPDKVNPKINYMLPIKITDASGTTISGNFGVAYYHMIGNPLAGNFTHEWLRWNGQTGTGTGTPDFDVVYDDVFAPVDPTTIEVQSNTGMIYILSFDNNSGVLSNFQVAFPHDDGTGGTVGTASWAGITITSGPTILLADPINNKFTFLFNYTNSAGAPRVIQDLFY